MDGGRRAADGGQWKINIEKIIKIVIKMTSLLVPFLSRYFWLEKKAVKILDTGRTGISTTKLISSKQYPVSYSRRRIPAVVDVKHVIFRAVFICTIDLNNWEVHPKPIVTHSHSFFRASRQLHVITSSFDWFTISTMLHDWLNNLRRFLIQSGVKPNVFPGFTSATCNYFEF